MYSLLARHLNIDRNELYRQSKQRRSDEKLVARIKEVRAKHPHYGYRRIALDLGINKKPVQRVCKLYGLLLPNKTKKITYSRSGAGDKPAPKNLLRDLNIVASYPNRVWACDFTYIKCMGRWYYVATVIDIYTREIIGWSVSTRHNTELILRALYDALSSNSNPLYMHFDRGSEYLSYKHIDMIESLEINASASDKGSPWQNGFQERFYGTFKLEIGSVADVQEEGILIERIALTLNYYNTQRIHTELITNPRQFRINYENKKAKRAKTIKAELAPKNYASTDAKTP